ncbi:MAG: hypothetical protein ACFFCQ_09880, partial [Promethearchaeota archaeon]
MTKITNFKEIIGWTGLVLAIASLLAYLLLFFDLLLFNLGPWPSITGEEVERRIIIKQSYLWIQYTYNSDQMLIPTLLGWIIWKFGGLIIGIGVGLFLRSSHELTGPNNNNKNPLLIFRDITTQEKKKFVI